MPALRWWLWVSGRNRTSGAGAAGQALPCPPASSLPHPSRPLGSLLAALVEHHPCLLHLSDPASSCISVNPAAATFRSFGEFAELPLLAVRPELQRRNGLGRLLLAAVEQLLLQAGSQVREKGHQESGWLPQQPHQYQVPDMHALLALANVLPSMTLQAPE